MQEIQLEHLLLEIHELGRSLRKEEQGRPVDIRVIKTLLINSFEFQRTDYPDIIKQIEATLWEDLQSNSNECSHRKSILSFSRIHGELIKINTAQPSGWIDVVRMIHGTLLMDHLMKKHEKRIPGYRKSLLACLLWTQVRLQMVGLSLLFRLNGGIFGFEGFLRKLQIYNIGRMLKRLKN